MKARQTLFLAALTAGAFLLVAVYWIMREQHTTQPIPPEWIVAHRGASGQAPENTIASVRLAWVLKADAVEVDVHLTRDGQIVCLHDETLERTTNGNGNVRDKTWDELKRLDAGSWKDQRFAGERIPLLSEVLDTVPDGKRLFVEIKAGKELTGELVRLLKEHASAGKITVISFDVDALDRLKRELPDVPCFWIVDAERASRFGGWKPIKERVAQQARDFGFEGIDISDGGFSKELLLACRENKLELHVWTVDDPERARELAMLGVDGITTNRPEAIRAAFAPPFE